MYSSVTSLIVDCLDKGTIQTGMKVMITGFGVGLSLGGTILNF